MITRNPNGSHVLTLVRRIGGSASAMLAVMASAAIGYSSPVMAAGTFTAPSPTTVTFALTGPVKSCTLSTVISAFTFGTGTLTGSDTTYALGSASSTATVIHATCTPTVTSPNITVTSDQTAKIGTNLGMGKSSSATLNAAADNEDLRLFLGGISGTACTVASAQVASATPILSAWATPTPATACDIAVLPTTTVVDYGSNSFDDTTQTATLTFTLSAT